MNQLVLSGTAPLVLSRTESSCYRGPKSSSSACFSALCGRCNVTNILTLTSCCESVRCEQVVRRSGEDASCTFSFSRAALLQSDSPVEATRAFAVARKRSRSSVSTSLRRVRHFPLRQLTRREELCNIRGGHDARSMPEAAKWALTLSCAVRDDLNEGLKAAGNKSSGLTHSSASSKDAAPPWRKAKALMEGAGSRRSLSGRRDPAAPVAGVKLEGRAADPDLEQQYGVRPRHQRRALQFGQSRRHRVSGVDQRRDNRLRFLLPGHDLVHPRVKAVDRDPADFEAKRAQQAADHVLHGQHPAEHCPAPDQQRLQGLYALRLDVDSPEPAGPCLYDVFCVVPIDRQPRSTNRTKIYISAPPPHWSASRASTDSACLHNGRADA